MSKAICYLIDHFAPYDTASLHVSDLVIQRGYGTFEFFREINGKVPFLDEYLDRFYHAAEVMGLKVPIDRSRIEIIIRHLLSENLFVNSGIKIILTGGYAEDYYTPAEPNLIILNNPFRTVTRHLENGVKLLLFEYKRFLPEVKTINYLPALWMSAKLREKGAIEPLYHYDGKILETSRSNIFLVKNGIIATPVNGILPGISCKHLIKVARSFYKVEERDVPLDEIETADEIFITGTSKHLYPVVQIDDHRIGDGKPGSVTRKLMAEFEKYISNQ